MSRWAIWKPSEYGEIGGWAVEWSSTPAPEQVACLVEDLVSKGFLPACMAGSTGGTVTSFANGVFNCLFRVRCSCYWSYKRSDSSCCMGNSCYVDVDSDSAEEGQEKATGDQDHQHHRHDPQQRGEPKLQQHAEKKSPPLPIPTDVLLRVAMPVDPYYKMESEMAAMHFARMQGVPVPTVYMYDSAGAGNALGLEWALMEKVPSCCDLDNFLRNVRCALDNQGEDPYVYSNWDQWGRLGGQLIHHLQALRRPSFDKIGSLYWDHKAYDFFVGPPSDPFLVANRRLLYYDDRDTEKSRVVVSPFDLTRRPFSDIADYLNTYLEIWMREVADTKLRVDLPVASTPPGPPSDPHADDQRLDGCHDRSVEEDEEPWYLQDQVDKIQDLVSQLRTVIIPYLTAEMDAQASASEANSLATHVSHPDLHAGNILLNDPCLEDGLNKPAQTKEEDRMCQISHLHHPRQQRHGDLSGLEFQLEAIIDWEHVLVLPEFLTDPPSIHELFRCYDTMHVPSASKIRSPTWLLLGRNNAPQNMTAYLASTVVIDSSWRPSEKEGASPGRAPPGDMLLWTSCDEVSVPFAHLSTAQPTRLMLLLQVVHSEIRGLGTYGRCAQTWIDELAEAIRDLSV